MWMERFRRRYAATERSDVRVAGKKRKRKKNQTFVPVLQQRQLQEGFQSKILQINFVGGNGVETQQCIMICDLKEKKKFGLSVFTFFRLMLNCCKCLIVSFACRRVDTCAWVTYLLTPNKYTTRLMQKA